MQLRALVLAATLAAVAASCSSDSGGNTVGSAAPDTTAAPNTTVFEDGSDCPRPDGSSKKIVHFATAPPTCIDASMTYTANITTNLGVMTITLDPAAAP